jgi:hypothetical protein
MKRTVLIGIALLGVVGCGGEPPTDDVTKASSAAVGDGHYSVASSGYFVNQVLQPTFGFEFTEGDFDSAHGGGNYVAGGDPWRWDARSNQLKVFDAYVENAQPPGAGNTTISTGVVLVTSYLFPQDGPNVPIVDHNAPMPICSLTGLIAKVPPYGTDLTTNDMPAYFGVGQNVFTFTKPQVYIFGFKPGTSAGGIGAMSGSCYWSHDPAGPRWMPDSVVYMPPSQANAQEGYGYLAIYYHNPDGYRYHSFATVNNFPGD